MNSGAMLAIDCEMVLCNDGTEAVVRVCVVDSKLEVTYYFAKWSDSICVSNVAKIIFSQVKLDELVNPLKAVADYRTNITGVSKKDLEGVKFSLVDVQVLCFYKLLVYY
jgi:RNA exonuclease 1